MGTEIELKLIIEPKHVDDFFQLPLIGEFALGACKKKKLFSRYYDTPDYLLWVHGVALRIRKDDDAFIQTLKRKGRTVKGLSNREEWQWPLDDASPDVSLVPVDLWPPAVQSQLPKLHPLFDTSFTRVLWELKIPRGALSGVQGGGLVEMVLDQGNIEAKTRAGIKTSPILEVELELKQGIPDCLACLSSKIAEYLPVRPSDLSKAERGYRLLGV